MNILYLAHRIPFPPDKGDKLRAFRHVERLSQSHQVWCACFVDRPAEFRHVAGLRKICRDVTAIEIRPLWARFRGIRGLIGGETMTESFYGDAAMIGAIRRWLRTIRFDVVVAFSSSMAQFALRTPARRWVLDLCDCDSQKWLEYARRSGPPTHWLYAVEAERLALRESVFLQSFDATLVASEAEAEPLQPSAARGRLHVVGNGVALPELEHDDTPFQPRLGGQEDSDKTIHAGTPTVGFVGMMNYRPNVDAVCWFAGACWPAIREAHPTAVFRVVGRCPTRAVRKLGRHPGVQVVGEVDNIGWEVRRFDVSVAPLRIARGVQNKVLEAMAHSKPVVLTRFAAEGIGGRHGHEYLVADTPEAIIRDVRRLLGDRLERERIGSSARRFVAAHHRWSDRLDQFEWLVTGCRDRSLSVAAVAKASRGDIGDYAGRNLEATTGKLSD